MGGAGHVRRGEPDRTGRVAIHGRGHSLEHLRDQPGRTRGARPVNHFHEGDGWDGLGAVILSAVACADVLPPDGSLSIAAPVDIVAEAVFTASLLLLVALVQRLRRAHTVAQAEIVERRRVEDALRVSEGRLLAEHAAAEAARQVAEGALRVQDDFLATVSHELQTPLTAVGAGLGLLGMSASERLRPSERALLDNALRNAELLRRQISDLLTLNKVTAGALALDREALDLRAVVGEAATAIRALARRAFSTWRCWPVWRRASPLPSWASARSTSCSMAASRAGWARRSRWP